MEQIMLTVITPVFQGRKYIESCLKSVIEQNCDRAEHLIIDGGSTDGTMDIVRSFAQRYPHIRWISEKDKGQSDAMNKGVRLAKGNIVSFLNADDYYEPGALNEAVSIMEKMREPAFLAGNCRIWDNNHQLFKINKPKRLDVASIILTWVFPCNPSAYFYHKSLHDAAGYYDENDHDSMDLEFILRALPKAHTKYVDRIWGNYRLLEDTKTFRSLQAGKTYQIIGKLFKTHTELLPWFPRMYIKIKGKIWLAGIKIKYYGGRILYYVDHPGRIFGSFMKKVKS